jgi:hypothetical protein
MNRFPLQLFLSGILIVSFIPSLDMALLLPSKLYETERIEKNSIEKPAPRQFGRAMDARQGVQWDRSKL